MEDRGRDVNKRIILECTVQKEDGYAWSDYFGTGWEL